MEVQAHWRSSFQTASEFAPSPWIFVQFMSFNFSFPIDHVEIGRVFNVDISDLAPSAVVAPDFFVCLFVCFFLLWGHQGGKTPRLGIKTKWPKMAYFWAIFSWLGGKCPPCPHLVPALPSVWPNKHWKRVSEELGLLKSSRLVEISNLNLNARILESGLNIVHPHSRNKSDK